MHCIRNPQNIFEVYSSVTELKIVDFKSCFAYVTSGSYVNRLSHLHRDTCASDKELSSTVLSTSPVAAERHTPLKNVSKHFEPLVTLRPISLCENSSVTKRNGSSRRLQISESSLVCGRFATTRIIYNWCTVNWRESWFNVLLYFWRWAIKITCEFCASLACESALQKLQLCFIAIYAIV